MSQTPSELKYASSHEWARLEEDGTVTVGQVNIEVIERPHPASRLRGQNIDDGKNLYFAF